MIETKNIFDTLVVVKRSGQRTEFNGEKIALAIKKAFDSVEKGYRQEDVNKVYQKVLKEIEISYQDRKTIKIEDIQDLIESQLKTLKFDEVYEAFSSYRVQRATSRETFVVKQQHKFLKAIENLGFNNLSEKESGKVNLLEDKSGREVLNSFGETISKEFAKAYLLDNKYVRAHDDGIIYIHHLNTLAMGMTQSMFIELDRLYKNEFSIFETHFTTPLDLMEAIGHSLSILTATRHDQSGNQSFGAFDIYLAPYVMKTFQKNYQQFLSFAIERAGFSHFISIEKLNREIEKMTTLDSVIFPYYLENQVLQHLFESTFQEALQKTEIDTREALRFFLRSVNLVYSKSASQKPTVSIAFGTDQSKAGRMIVEEFLHLLEEENFGVNPEVYFKLSTDCNFQASTVNHDLYQLACRVASKRDHFSFIMTDVPYNSCSDLFGISYLPGGERVLEDITSLEERHCGGKGTVATTSINLPRIAIRHGACFDAGCNPNMKEFYQELGEIMDLVKDQMLERFEIQCSKHSYNFPFLIEQGIWTDGEKVKPGDRLRKILKHGVLAIHFVGLAETLRALYGKHHGEEELIFEKGLEIVKFMEQRVTEYSENNNLNFVLTGVDYDYVSERFLNIDKAIYGRLKGVTDRDRYTTSFHIPIHTRIRMEDRIERESRFHPLLKGGHQFIVELDSDKEYTQVDIDQMLRKVAKVEIGCMKFTRQ